MGKIKSKLVRRAANSFSEKGIEFSEDFEENKKILGKEMPSKKVKNQLAGFCSRKIKQENIEKAKLNIE